MPKPNCTAPAERDLGVIDFGQLGRRVVEGRFNGDSMTSDAGVMLLGQVDRKLGLMDAAARCIADPRNPLLVLDFDATDNPLHGQQEGCFFHGYYDSYCYLPLYVFCAQRHRWRAPCSGRPVRHPHAGPIGWTTTLLTIPT